MKIRISPWLCMEFDERELTDQPYARIPRNGPFMLEATEAEARELLEEAQFQLECAESLEPAERRTWQALNKQISKLLGIPYRRIKKGN